MIVLDKTLESLLGRYIKEHCLKQKSIGLLGTAGYLIGSKVDDDVHVAHISICPLPDTADDQEGDARSRLVDAEWIGDHGARVVRLLPGGIDVVGLLWLADRKLGVEPRLMLVQALSIINKHASLLSSLHLRQSDNNLALITVETPLGKPMGYIVDCTRRGTEGYQTKVTYSELEWIGVDSSVELHAAVPVDDGALMTNFQKQFNFALRGWAEDYIKTDVALVNGSLRAGDEPLRGRDKRSRGGAAPNVRVETFISAGKKQMESKGSKINSLCVVDVNASVRVRAAVSSKATVQKAIDAVKQHVIRTLCSRAELHHESTDVVEDEQKDRISVHQLPRIAITRLPWQHAIVFADYLFEGDSKKDARDSFKDLLSLDVEEDDIDDDSERILADDDLAQVSEQSDRTSRIHRSSSSTSSQNSSSVILPVVGKPLPLPVSYITLLSIIAVLLAVAVYLLIHSLGD